jgi:hypothetical protein
LSRTLNCKVFYLVVWRSWQVAIAHRRDVHHLVLHLVAGPIVRAASFLHQLGWPPEPMLLRLPASSPAPIGPAVVANRRLCCSSCNVFFDPSELDVWGVHAYAIQTYRNF